MLSYYWLTLCSNRSATCGFFDDVKTAEMSNCHGTSVGEEEEEKIGLNRNCSLMRHATIAGRFFPRLVRQIQKTWYVLMSTEFEKQLYLFAVFLSSFHLAWLKMRNTLGRLVAFKSQSVESSGGESIESIKKKNQFLKMNFAICVAWKVFSTHEVQYFISMWITEST